MINHRISVDWSTTKPIAAFSCTRRVQEVHTKAEVVHLTPILLGLGVIYFGVQQPTLFFTTTDYLHVHTQVIIVFRSGAPHDPPQ